MRARLAALEAEAKRLAQSPATRNGPEIHAICNESARIRLSLREENDEECPVLIEVDGPPQGEKIGDCVCGRPVYRSHFAGTIYHALDAREEV